MIEGPIAYTEDGRPLFDNTPTVVCMIARGWTPGSFLAVRRNNEPGKGLLGLPGGYHMRGESWQEAGIREVYEETGYLIHPGSVRLISLVTDEYGNNLIIAEGSASFLREATSNEVQEVLVMTNPGSPTDWAFPRHYEAVKSIFN